MLISRLRTYGFVAALVATTSSTQAQIVHVDASATGANDGTSWTDAYVDLQSALAVPGATIWTARGTYRPAPPSGPTTARFELNPGTKLYGGFAGFETSFDQRDVAANPTILSGDLRDDDVPNFGNRTDNCRFVVRMTDVSADTVLDGVVVEGAYSNDTSSLDGGGVVVRGHSARVEHCWIRDNQNARYGGGVFCNSAQSRIVACTIEGNRALADGGGIDLESGGFVERCVFIRNRAQDYGGGMFHFGAARIDDCVFVGNQSLHGGALSGMYDQGFITGCTVVANVSSLGPAVDAVGMTLRNSIVWDNVGAEVGVQLVQRSTVQGYSGTDGLDPRFANARGADGVHGTADDDLRLLPGSPCIDAGDNSYVLASALVDVAGLRRFSDDPDTVDTGVGVAPIVDRGAHEYRPCTAPVSFCVTSPNSVGPGALMSSSGTAKLYANDLVLETSGCPPNTFGLYFHGSTTQQAPFGNGFRCVGGNVQRVGIVAADATGVASIAFDASTSPIPLAAGTQRHFQFWYRNLAGGGAGFNLSDGLTVQFCP